MPLTDFTYYVTSGASDVQIYPQFDEDVDLFFEETEDDELGVYIRRLSTEIKFAGDDYDYFNDNWESQGNCASLPFIVKYQDSEFYKGILKVGTSNTDWDHSICEMTARIEPSGGWVCLKDEWEEEFNILQNSTKVEVQTFLGTLSETTCTSASLPEIIPSSGYAYTNLTGCLSNPDAYSLKRYYVQGTSGDYFHNATWVTEQVTVACVSGSPVTPPGDGWELITDNCPTDATYGRAPVMEYTGPVAGLPIDERWSVVGADYTAVDNGVMLQDILEDHAPSCITGIQSDFLGINPQGDAPSNSVYTTASGNLSDIVVFQKSDMKFPDASQNAFNGKWTYKEILESLKAQFDIEWRVNGTGDTLRIEHTSFYSSTSGLDLVTNYPDDIAGLHAYTYRDGEVAQYEEWKFMETVSQDFLGTSVRYDQCISEESQDVVSYSYGQVNNDVSYIQNNTDQVSDEGFVFVNTYVSGSNYYFISETSTFSGNLLVNGHLCTPNLLENYHTYNRLFPTGYMNNVLTTFDASLPRRTQVEIQIRYPLADFPSFDASQLVRTQLGWGEIDRMTYSAATEVMTLTIKH